MKYLIDINERTQKGKEALAMLHSLGLKMEKAAEGKKVDPTVLGLPGHPPEPICNRLVLRYSDL